MAFLGDFVFFTVFLGLALAFLTVFLGAAAFGDLAFLGETFFFGELFLGVAKKEISAIHQRVQQGSLQTGCNGNKEHGLFCAKPQKTSASHKIYVQRTVPQPIT